MACARSALSVAWRRAGWLPLPGESTVSCDAFARSSDHAAKLNRVAVGGELRL